MSVSRHWTAKTGKNGLLDVLVTEWTKIQSTVYSILVNVYKWYHIKLYVTPFTYSKCSMLNICSMKHTPHLNCAVRQLKYDFKTTGGQREWSVTGGQ